MSLQQTTMLTCPYNKSHVVSDIRYGNHVIKCYHQHCQQQRAKNAEPLFAMCRFNADHHIQKELLKSHEASCQDSPDYVPSGNANEAVGVTKATGKEALSCSGMVEVDVSGTENKSEVNTATGSTDDEKKHILDEVIPNTKVLSKKAAVENEDPSNAGVKYDAEKTYQELKAAGYKVLRASQVKGMTTQEMWAFYKAEKKREEVEQYAILHTSF